MATTLSNFVKHANADLIGTTVAAASAVSAHDPSVATELVNGGQATAIDKFVVDFATDANAKHGVGRYALVGTTVKTVDLTNLATGAASSAGDAVFAKLNTLLITNDGAADITIASGASNPATLGFAGTTPTLTVPAGKTFVLIYATAGVTVDSTHKTIDVTPTSGGSVVVAVAGS